MALPERMKFGIFMAPFHWKGENPTLSLERDLETIQWLDYLGFDEAWVGEHHSAGWEIIASPEIFMATAAERTRNIKLGTGVISLPYHNPLMVANRMVLLDHLTRGRTMMGVGPGALSTDAAMLGIDPVEQRRRMDEAMTVIMRLLRETEPDNSTSRSGSTWSKRSFTSGPTPSLTSLSRWRRRSRRPAWCSRASTAPACCR